MSDPAETALPKRRAVGCQGSGPCQRAWTSRLHKHLKRSAPATIPEESHSTESDLSTGPITGIERESLGMLSASQFLRSRPERETRADRTAQQQCRKSPRQAKSARDERRHIRTRLRIAFSKFATIRFVKHSRPPINGIRHSTTYTERNSNWALV
jgi:hypothetical protein